MTDCAGCLSSDSNWFLLIYYSISITFTRSPCIFVDTTQSIYIPLSYSNEATFSSIKIKSKRMAVKPSTLGVTVSKLVRNT